MVHPDLLCSDDLGLSSPRPGLDEPMYRKFDTLDEGQ